MQAKPEDGPGAWVDPDDAPELTAEWFAQADVYHGEKLISRGRPPIGKAKQLVTLRLVPDVLARLRASGPGWQTRPVEAIRRLVTARFARRSGSAPEQISPAPPPASPQARPLLSQHRWRSPPHGRAVRHAAGQAGEFHVAVTGALTHPGPLVPQAFRSALPLAYQRQPSALSQPFATLLLEAGCEATLCAGKLCVRRGGSNIVRPTRLGGGAFGNGTTWINAAIRARPGLPAASGRMSD